MTPNSRQSADTACMPIEPLIFIDANVFLNLYGSRDQTSIDALMRKVLEEHERIIFSEQLAMEVLKNRRSKFSAIEAKLADIPGPLSHFSTKDERKALINSVRATNAELAKARQALAKIVKSPERHDEIYKCVVGLIDHSGPLCLTRDMGNHAGMLARARERYLLRYPPQKKDESYGDAFHWEWIVYCATSRHRDVYLVSQDSDFGHKRAGALVIDEFLDVEFRRRTKRKVTLVDKLHAVIEVPAKLAEAEDEAVKQSRAASAEATGRRQATGHEFMQWLMTRAEPEESLYAANVIAEALLKGRSPSANLGFGPLQDDVKAPDSLQELVSQPENPLLVETDERSGADEGSDATDG